VRVRCKEEEKGVKKRFAKRRHEGRRVNDVEESRQRRKEEKARLL